MIICDDSSCRRAWVSPDRLERLKRLVDFVDFQPRGTLGIRRLFKGIALSMSFRRVFGHVCTYSWPRGDFTRSSNFVVTESASAGLFRASGKVRRNRLSTESAYCRWRKKYGSVRVIRTLRLESLSFREDLWCSAPRSRASQRDCPMS